MPDIVNADAVRFCNDKLRPLADRLAQTYYLLVALRDEWVANGMAAKIPNTIDVVIDGASLDGRHVITGADVNALAARATDLIADYQAAVNAKLNTVLKVAVNPYPR